MVETSKLDGTERRVITDTHLGHPHGISEFQEYVWFTEWNEDMIVRVNKATGEIRVRLRGSMTRPTGVQVVHPSRREISSKLPWVMGIKGHDLLPPYLSFIVITSLHPL